MDSDGKDDPAPGTPAFIRRTDTLSTYRHLRLAMVFLLLMLLVAVAEAALVAEGPLCFEGSISAYYFTSARAVFVAVLCALGACLIVYRGKTDHEDVALNVSGALAFVVAFVPTSTPKTEGVECSASNVPTFGQLDMAIDNNMRAYFIVAVITLVTAVALGRGRPRSVIQTRGQIGLALLLVVGIASFWMWPEGFRDNAHSAAAILTFLGILAVVALNAVRIKAPARVDALPPTEPTGTRCPGRTAVADGTGSRALVTSQTAGALYVAIAGLMLVSFLVAGGLHLALDDWRHGILVIETLLLVEFLFFWLVQTSELWDDDEEPPPPPAAPETTAAEVVGLAGHGRAVRPRAGR